MSQQGITLAAKMFSDMQQLRLKLIQMGCDDGKAKTPEGKQDILLGHLFEKANDAVKDEFARLVSMVSKGKQ